MKIYSRLILLILFLSVFGFCAEKFTVDIQSKVYQGNSFVVSLNGVLKSPAKVYFRQANYPLYQVTTNHFAVIIGVSYEVPVGTYALLVKDALGRKLAQGLVKVMPTKFKTSVIVISDEKQAEGATDFSVLAKENKVLVKAFRAQKPKRFWQGNFLRPIKKFVRITSPYGTQRFYKDEKGKEISSWAHRGVDYAALPGIPVFAAQDGYITVSQLMQIHGNAIAIDHGQGIISIYNHLKDRVVQVGEYVRKGQLVGHVGNTGLSTGNHLHYGLSVNNVRVNPWEWFQKGF